MYQIASVMGRRAAGGCVRRSVPGPDVGAIRALVRSERGTHMRPIVLLLASVFMLSTGGCATTGDVDALTERVTALESQSAANAGRIGALEARFGEVAATAERSAERASQAEARAQAAEGRADDAARKADAIFRKSVSK